MSRFKFMLKYTPSIIIDISVVYAISYLLKICLTQFMVVDSLTFLIIFLFVNTLYSFIFYVLFKTTLGKNIFSLILHSKKGELNFNSLIIRELFCKLPTLSILFFSVYYFTLHYNLILLIFALSLLFILLLIFILFKNNLWGILCETTFKNYIDGIKSPLVFYVVYVFIIFLSYFLIKIENNQTQSNNLSFLGLKLPEKFPEYPHDNDIKNYFEFISHQSSAIDYIFELYKKYDIVILCEPNHREIRNWDFITKLVSDKRFIDNVGHAFTEYG